jgi:hypothetical protein
MRVLLYSAVLYLLGITIVLYIRPQIMFHRDGRWKEFGINGVETTYFPFWFFCIAWAVVAYGIVRIFFSENSAPPGLAVENMTPAPAPKAEALSPLPVPQAPTQNSTQGKPGYYKLDEAILKEKGTPLYVYIGPDKPPDLD